MSAFSIMAKPMGPRCSLDCAYPEKAWFYPNEHTFRMSDEVLDAHSRDTIAAKAAGEGDIMFFWQGGEPTLAGRPGFSA